MSIHRLRSRLPGRPALLMFALAMASCSALTTAPPTAPSPAAVSVGHALSSHAHHGAAVGSGWSITAQELARLRAATAKYHRPAAAVADGYVVRAPVGGQIFVPGMGVHFLNPALAGDPAIDLARPELLLYTCPPNEGPRLVAVEYVTGIADLNNPPPPPPGFTGTGDLWIVNTEFSLWTLHAWVWLENPDGMFAPFNPQRVPATGCEVELSD